MLCRRTYFIVLVIKMIYIDFAFLYLCSLIFSMNNYIFFNSLVHYSIVLKMLFSFLFNMKTVICIMILYDQKNNEFIPCVEYKIISVSLIQKSTYLSLDLF